jgi:hypothetical protein
MTQRVIKTTKINHRPRFTKWWSTWTDYKFWSKPERWPDDAPDYIFLARAFEKIGNAMFGDYWLGNEHLAKTDWDSDPGLIARRAAVLQEMAKRLRSGELISATRPIPGGAINDAPKDWWNSELDRVANRFMECEISTAKPFGGPILSPNNSWILGGLHHRYVRI